MKKILIPLVIIATIGILFYTIQGSGSQEENRTKKYMAEIQQERSEKNTFLRHDDQSPLSPEQKKRFSSLNYFEPSPEYRIEARVEENEEKDLLMLATSDNKQKPFKKWGYAIFELEGKEHRLLLLQPAFGIRYEGLFLPFSDATSAKETYGAGRYLDLEKPRNEKIILDFNRAYNPDCAYSDDNSCPFPPKENLLPVAIRAGEKTFEKHP
jgi:uncharacterized protein (DUF1684 family)